jgi:hypothetical protein
MLKVDDLVGTDIHLLASDVKQLTGVVSPMLGLTKLPVSDLQLQSTAFSCLSLSSSHDVAVVCSSYAVSISG